MTYLYAGLGMAMLTAIMAMFEMAAGITNQQILSRPPEDPYYASGAQGIDQDALELAAKLESESVNTLSELCEKTNDLAKSYPALADYSFESLVGSDGRLIEGCATRPRLISGSGEHHIIIAPLMSLKDGKLVAVGEPRFKRLSLWSCVVRDSPGSCLHGS